MGTEYMAQWVRAFFCYEIKHISVQIHSTDVKARRKAMKSGSNGELLNEYSNQIG